jgi:hypothetical protein
MNEPKLPIMMHKPDISPVVNPRKAMNLGEGKTNRTKRQRTRVLKSHFTLSDLVM